MDYDNVRFPVRISLDAVGGPGFKTSVAVMASGAESRTQEWETERGEWTVSFHAKLPKEWEPALAFFRVIGKGMANTFRFKDWTDFVCKSGDGLFVDSEDGSPSVKQMVKRYRFTGIDGTVFTYDRVIHKPINGKITTDASGLEYATGKAATGSSWSGEFDCWARLNTDVAKAQVIDRNREHGLIVGWDGIEIVEVSHEQP